MALASAAVPTSGGNETPLSDPLSLATTAAAAQNAAADLVPSGFADWLGQQRRKHTPTRVAYEAGQFVLQSRDGTIQRSLALYADDPKLRVIGNIYEDDDLFPIEKS